MNRSMVGRPIATYSIVARAADGAFGVAVQSHWYNVGAVVPWIEAGVGAVVAQAFSPPTQGQAVLSQLRSGTTAAAAIAAVLDGDTQDQYRQLAAVDATGLAAAHTGNRCIPESGNHLGAGYSTQANLMDRPTVWGAMGEAYESSDEDLTERLLAALEAAEREGGDIRGRQSAAIVVVESRPALAPPLDRVFDLRVEDHTDPVGELRRLVTLRRAYILLNEGDQLVAKDDIDGAVTAYTAAAALLPDDAADGEPAFWTGVALAGSGQIESAADHLAKAQQQSTAWSKLLPRLVPSGLLHDDRIVEELVKAMERSERPA